MEKSIPNSMSLIVSETDVDYKEIIDNWNNILIQRKCYTKY